MKTTKLFVNKWIKKVGQEKVPNSLVDKFDSNQNVKIYTKSKYIRPRWNLRKRFKRNCALE